MPYVPPLYPPQMPWPPLSSVVGHLVGVVGLAGLGLILGGAACGAGSDRSGVAGAPPGAGMGGSGGGGNGGTGAGASPGLWPASTAPSAPVAMDDVTVFAFSQVPTSTGTETDPQVLELAPDMSIRNWQRWRRDGFSAADYNASYVTASHAAGVRFMGGTTATAMFEDEWDTTATFEDAVTRDASGAIVSHDNIVPLLHRGSLASAAYRASLVRVCELQIDAGVDGLFFDELNGDYQGAAFDGNEGFDDHHLADFNAYVLARYPAGTDLASMFGMTADNRLRADVPAGDLTANFNYRQYLASHGWVRTPFAPENPLAAVWGLSKGNRPRPGAPTFEDTAEPYVYFRLIVDELRAYARATAGRDIFITSNGVFPLVDFQSVGLYDFNDDGDGGAEANYVPVSGGHLAGDRSLQSTFRRLKARAQTLAPGAPVVLFIDWPGGPMDRYDSLPLAERQDYWRLYGAEAYANGLFFAFHLRTTTGEPTATDLGMMPFFKTHAAFFRTHASLYHGVTASTTVATATAAAASAAVVANLALAVTDQAMPPRRLVHVVNHNYNTAFVAQAGVTLAVPSDSAPAAVTLASPDAAGDIALPFTFAGGQVTVLLPSLIAYDVVAVAY
jgi:hypothetical protein